MQVDGIAGPFIHQAKVMSHGVFPWAIGLIQLAQDSKDGVGGVVVIKVL